MEIQLSVYFDTVKGGYRSREANVHNLLRFLYIIDQCVMQGVPLAREYGGLLDNRSLEDFGSKNFLCQRTNRTTIITRCLFCNEPSDWSWKD
jgi:hypothetical protein